MIKVVWVKSGERNEKTFNSMDGTAGAEAFMMGLKQQGDCLYWWEDIK
jgi:hypothetical protein